MFFMIGITEGRKDIDFSQTVICDACGKYGRYQVFMTYMSLLLFFIPCFRWNRRYYVQMSCCGTQYELDPGVGKRVARGENVEIRPEHLQRVRSAKWDYPYKKCVSCGFRTSEDFQFCPKCGMKF